MSHEDLPPTCPRCGSPMIAGAILGLSYRLRWVSPAREGLWANIGWPGEPIGTGGPWTMRRPELKGHRCEKCHLIIANS